MSLRQSLSLILEAVLHISAPLSITHISGEFLLLTNGSSKVGTGEGIEAAFAKHFCMRMVTFCEGQGTSGGLD